MTVFHRLILEAIASGISTHAGIVRSIRKRTQYHTNVLGLLAACDSLVHIGFLVDTTEGDPNSPDWCHKYTLGPNISAKRRSPRSYEFDFTELEEVPVAPVQDQSVW